MKLVNVTCCTILLIFTACKTSSISVVKESDTEKIALSYREFATIDTMTLPIPRESISVAVIDSVSILESSVAISVARLRQDGTILHELHNKARNCTILVPSKTIVRDSIVFHGISSLEISKEKQVGRCCSLMRYTLYTLLVLIVLFFVFKFMKHRISF